jgi:hypothetical protein
VSLGVGRAAGSLHEADANQCHCVFSVPSFAVLAGANCVTHSTRRYVTSFEHVPLRIDPVIRLPLNLLHTGHRKHNKHVINHRQGNSG